jgi:hypothetical protein
MLGRSGILVLVILLAFACKKEEEPDGNSLPPGTSPYTETEIDFVPYSTGPITFKKAPGFTETLTLNFVERLATEQVFAWDQTFFKWSTDAALQLEFRLRYLQAEDEAQKTLAIYLPYRDNSGTVRSSIFETPIVTTGLSDGFFADLVSFHTEIELHGTVWNNVFEINPLVTTEPGEDSPLNFSKVFYTQSNGIIVMIQKNGDEWVLQP